MPPKYKINFFLPTLYNNEENPELPGKPIEPRKFREAIAKIVEKFKGIGGWLILPIIAFFIAIATFIFDIIFSLGLDSLSLILIIILDGIGIFLFANALSLIFAEKKKAPIWAIFAMWYGVLLTIVSAIIIKEEEFFVDVMRQVIWAFIWTWYFNVSKRVKNTFVK